MPLPLFRLAGEMLSVSSNNWAVLSSFMLSVMSASRGSKVPFAALPESEAQKELGAAGRQLTPTLRGSSSVIGAALRFLSPLLHRARAESGVLKERGNGRTTMWTCKMSGDAQLAGFLTVAGPTAIMRLYTCSLKSVSVISPSFKRSGV